VSTLRVGERLYELMDVGGHLSGGEILYLRCWSDMFMSRHELEARMRSVFSWAMSADAEFVEASLQVRVEGRRVATFDVCVTDEGLEMSGFSLGDSDFDIVSDVEALLGLSRRDA